MTEVQYFIFERLSLRCHNTFHTNGTPRMREPRHTITRASWCSSVSAKNAKPFVTSSWAVILSRSIFLRSRWATPHWGRFRQTNGRKLGWRVLQEYSCWSEHLWQVICCVTSRNAWLVTYSNAVPNWPHLVKLILMNTVKHYHSCIYGDNNKRQ